MDDAYAKDIFGNCRYTPKVHPIQVMKDGKVIDVDVKPGFHWDPEEIDKGIPGLGDVTDEEFELFLSNVRKQYTIEGRPDEQFENFRQEAVKLLEEARRK